MLSTLDEPRLTPEDTAELVLAIMPPKLREIFEPSKRSTSPTPSEGSGASG